MKKIYLFIFTILFVCFFIPRRIEAKTDRNLDAFELYYKDEGNNTCRITEIRLNKDKGISEIKIPEKVNGKTVVSIGVGKITNMWNEKEETNAFFMHVPCDDESGKWPWISESKVQERRAAKIKSIILPDTIKEIKEFAFAGLSNLKAIKLSQNLTVIGECAFGATSIRKMQFPPNLTTTGKQLFFRTPVKKINIPAKLKEGVPELARTTASWKRFTVSKKNPYYKVKSGLLFSKDGKILYAMVKPKKNVRIPDNVKRMDAFAFYKRSPQSVYIGAGVREMGGCSLSTKTRCKVVLSPQNRYLARSGMCIYRKKKRELLVGIPKGRVFRISRKVKKLVTNVSLVGIEKKYKVRKVYIPKSVETIEYGWGLGGFVHKNCRYYTERNYWTLYS